MFGLFRKDPVKKLEAEYARLLEKARDIQRNGDVVESARVTAEAEKIGDQIDALKAGK